jgi:hypothetical protein
MHIGLFSINIFFLHFISLDFYGVNTQTRCFRWKKQQNGVSTLIGNLSLFVFFCFAFHCVEVGRTLFLRARVGFGMGLGQLRLHTLGLGFSGLEKFTTQVGLHTWDSGFSGLEKFTT